MTTTDRLTSRVGELLDLYGGEQVRVADLLCDQHDPALVAFTLVGPDMAQRDLPYGELRESSERFAAGLRALGVGEGTRVATLMGKSVEHLVAALAIWRLGAVHVPLFTAFAPPAIAMRVSAADAAVVVTDTAQREKLAGLGRQVVVAGTPGEGELSFADLLAQHEPGLPAVAVGGDAPLVQIFTSGTTGSPKAVVMPVRGLAAVRMYMEAGLDVRPDDVFWNAADPGWAYGHYYSLLGPLAVGVRSTWLTAGFDAALTWRILRELRVTNFAAAPTVYRALRQATSESAELRCASSAGEPLTAEVNTWAPAALGTVVRDHYGQTETGMVVNNHQHPALRPADDAAGFGVDMPGWRTAVLGPGDTSEQPPGEPGRLAVDIAASPLHWFRGYDGDETRSAEKLTEDGRWYLTGDTAAIDADGTHRFVGRDDDVIVMAGYRIGPGDVESVLLSHPTVTEAAVVAAPDELRGEVLEAFVVARDGGSDELTRELQQLVKSDFAAHAYPRRVHYVDALPKTASGKIQRFVLREQRRASGKGESA